MAFAVATMLATSSAYAADMPVRTHQPAYKGSAYVPVQNFSGLYAGGHIGLNISEHDLAASDVGLTVTSQDKKNGFEFGFDLLALHQFSNGFLGGLHVMAEFPRTKTSGDVVINGVVAPGTTAHLQTKWQLTAAPTVGFAVTPKDAILGYAGVTYRKVDLKVNTPGGSVSDDAKETTWTAGATWLKHLGQNAYGTLRYGYTAGSGKLGDFANDKAKKSDHSVMAGVVWQFAGLPY